MNTKYRIANVQLWSEKCENFGLRMQISLDSQALSTYDIYLTKLIVWEFIIIAKIGNLVKKVPPKAVNLMVNSE
jgi:hypothetical protein